MIRFLNWLLSWFGYRLQRDHFLSVSRGEYLDRIAISHGVERKRWFFGLLRETDSRLRLRLHSKVTDRGWNR